MFKVFAVVCAACFIIVSDSASSLDDPTPETDDPIASASRRTDLPRQQDTLRIGTSLKLKAAVDCHNPIIGIRVEFADGIGGQGDGNVISDIAFPVRGTNSNAFG